MIKTAGLSSPGPIMAEPGRVLAWSKSTIIDLQVLTGGIDQCLQTQARELELR